MKPMVIETAQMTMAYLPTVPARPPIENSTKAGAPLATQNASLHVIALRIDCGGVAAASVILTICPSCGLDLFGFYWESAEFCWVEPKRAYLLTRTDGYTLRLLEASQDRRSLPKRPAQDAMVNATGRNGANRHYGGRAACQ